MTAARGVPVAMKFAVWILGVGWLVDTCAGGTTSDRILDAVQFDSELDALDALFAAELLDRNDPNAGRGNFVVVSL